jgi:peptide/nickel transport system substrate-binding protein
VDTNYWKTYGRRRLSRRTFVGGSAVALTGAAAFLAGCGGGEKKESKAGTPAGGATTAVAAQATSAPGKRGGTLRISGPVLVVSMDPHDRITFAGNTTKVYSNLIMTQFSTQKVLFDAATALEQPDPLTIRFTMRDGMKFHDAANNRAVTAGDAAYSINRIATQAQRPGPLNGSNLQPLYWSWIDKAEAPDDKTLVIKQNKPYASALAILSTPWFAIVAKEVIEANGGFLKADVTKDAGSGPYILTQIRDNGYTWERWPGYWKHTNPSPTFVEDGPYIDKIDWRQIADPAALEAAFRAGDVDLAGNAAGNNQIVWDRAKADELKKAAGVKVAEAPNPLPMVGNFDMSRWGDDQRFREAASLAIDRDALIKQVYLGNGRLVGPVGPAFDFALPESQLKTLEAYDPKKAKQLWDAAGGNQKFPQIVILTQPTIAVFLQSSNFIAEEWKRNLGANVRIDSVDSTTYNRRANDFSQPTKDWDFFITYDPGLLTVPEANLLSNYVPSGYAGRNNLFTTDSPNPKTAELAKKFQALYDDQFTEADTAKRKAKLTTLQTELLTSFAPCIPIPVDKTAYHGYREAVKNFPVNDFPFLQASTGPLRVHDLWLDRA